eukprot:TRINITY_DN27752_c0_g1_i1.p1 TRINITY_DN27752_c0_g1~~TRINITY_DN27752_c0_g1_i1.p1  ORF type:complete len:121 (+),score=7.42 TRINITY_DN27752_c0_g1_i1:477-839(+)
MWGLSLSACAPSKALIEALSQLTLSLGLNLAEVASLILKLAWKEHTTLGEVPRTSYYTGSFFSAWVSSGLQASAEATPEDVAEAHCGKFRSLLQVLHYLRPLPGDTSCRFSTQDRCSRIC